MEDILHTTISPDELRDIDMRHALQTIAHGSRPNGRALSGENGRAIARAVLVKHGLDWTPNGERVRGMLAND